jgi:heavy-metal-associated domain-containing protein
MTSIQVIHDTPGRLRVAVPAITGSRTRCCACEESVRSLPGVRHVQANPRTGNLLVLYTPGALGREEIECHCASWGTQTPSPRVPAPRNALEAQGASRFLTVAAELLPHVLPLLFGSCPSCRIR